MDHNFYIKPGIDTIKKSSYTQEIMFWPPECCCCALFTFSANKIENCIIYFDTTCTRNRLCKFIFEIKCNLVFL